MKSSKLVPLALVVLAFLFLFISMSRTRKPDPKDLFFWTKQASGNDWSSEALRGEPEAQFFVGLILIKTNLQKMVDQVPQLSSIPVIGPRFFQHVSYQIDSAIPQEQLDQAYSWIKKSADQGYAPAREAEKLFAGRMTTPATNSGANPAR